MAQIIAARRPGDNRKLPGTWSGPRQLARERLTFILMALFTFGASNRGAPPNPLDSHFFTDLTVGQQTGSRQYFFPERA